MDTIDNLATSHHHNAGLHSTGATGEDATREGNSGQQQPAATAASISVPPLHRSDGGLGGIGRASEQQNNTNDNTNVGDDGADGYYGGNITNGIRMMSEEESSLAMAREFLSRLVS